jgi:hypothetical protein
VTPATYETAVRLASAPDRIRGYEEVKVRSARAARELVERERAALRGVAASA